MLLVVGCWLLVVGCWLLSRSYECVYVHSTTVMNWPGAESGVNSWRLRHHRPSSTHNCECSTAQKKSTRAKVRTQIKLKTQEARRSNAQISKDSKRATGASPVSTGESTSGAESPNHEENHKILPKAILETQNMYP